MKKFDLKKFLTENKATFHSSLNEGYDEFKRAEKGSKDVTAKDKGEEEVYGAGVKKGEEIEKKKMKVSELKANIKEMVLSEMALDVDKMEDAPEDEVDFLAELEGMLGDEGYEGSDDHFHDTIDESGLWPALMKFKDEGFSLDHVVGWIEANWFMIKEADEKAADEAAAEDVTVDDTETTDVETTAEVDPNVKAVQDSLTQAQAAAQALGDKKLLDQIGNTITFFTRTHVVEKPGAVA